MSESANNPVANTTKHELKPVRIKERTGAKQSGTKTNDQARLKKPQEKGAQINYIYAWQKELGKRLDDMVDSFLDFPPDTPQDCQDEQFARHLLWMLGDSRAYFVRLFRHGASAYELDCLWVRLFPYLTGEYPEEISPYDGRLTDFSLAMFKVTQDHIAGSTPFDELMKRIRQAVIKTRGS